MKVDFVLTRPHDRTAQSRDAVRLDDVSVEFGSAKVLDGLSLTVQRGSILTVLGPSGAGKTTLLRLMAGLIPPRRGTVLVEGAPPVPGRASAMVFQNYRLLPWASVIKNVRFPLELRGMDDAQCEARALHYLRLVGLERCARLYPGQLSGGMRQRAALARALVSEPALLLMDEPFASIDALTRHLLQRELLALLETRETTAVFVTHSVEEALLLGDRVALLGGAPARILEMHELPGRHIGSAQSQNLDRDTGKLRELLWNKLRDLVVYDPRSEFHSRAPGRRSSASKA